MSDEQANKSELIDRIMREARAEAEKVRADAERSIEERRKSLAGRLAEIEQSAEDRVADTRQRLEKRTDAAIALAEGRARLHREDRVYRSAEEGLRESMRALRGSDDYPRMLGRWIVEAAIGLGTDPAIVSCPADDLDYIGAATEAARSELERRGSSVSLELDADRHEVGQGVVARGIAGRRAFSNLVDDRIRRLGAELRRIVYHTVIEAQDE